MRFLDDTIAAMSTEKTMTWMPLNLPWNQQFWDGLDSMRAMRLNPHWHIEENDGYTEYDIPGDGSRYDIDDILADRQFTLRANIEHGQGHWKVTFNGVDLAIHARSEDNGKNTALAYEYTPFGENAPSSETMETLVRHWLPSIREYYRLFTADTVRNRFFRFFMDKVMLRMNPTQRRICAFMFKLTLLEVLLIIVLGVGFYFYANTGGTP